RGAQDGRAVARAGPGGCGAAVAVCRHQHDEPARERARDRPLAPGRARARGDRGTAVRAQAWQGEPVRARARRRQRPAARAAQPHGRRARERRVMEGRSVRWRGEGWIRVEARRPRHEGRGVSPAQDPSLAETRRTPDNPVHRLVRALSRIAAYQTPLIVTPATERYLRDLSTIEGDPARRVALADVRAALRDSTAVRALTADLTYNALLRNTTSITGLKASDKTNVIPPVASATLDVRLLPGQDAQAFLADLGRVVSGTAVAISPEGPNWPATESSTETELFRAIVTAARARDPKVLVTTPPLTGFTDSHYFRRLGIVSYGLS